MNVSVSPEIKAFVKAQVATGRYRNDSEVVREGLRMLEDQARQRRLEDLLLEGIDSGEPIPMDEKFWERAHEKLRLHVEENKSNRGND